jgi:hypothetical protein
MSDLPFPFLTARREEQRRAAEELRDVFLAAMLTQQEALHRIEAGQREEAAALRETVLLTAEGQQAALRRIQEHHAEESTRLRRDLAAMTARLDQMERALSAAAQPVESQASPEPVPLDIWLPDPISGRPFKVHRGHDGQVLACASKGGGRPVAVLSIPKAGTYLMGLLLQRLNFTDCELHLSQNFLTDYRGMSIQEKRGPSHEQHTTYISVGGSALLVGGGQFVVGHLPADAAARHALAGYNKIFLYRNLVDATLSHLRFMIDAGRAPAGVVWAEMEPSPEQAMAYLETVGKQLFAESYGPLVDWLDDPSVFSISFEALSGDEGLEARAERMAELATFLGIDDDIETLLANEVLGRPTKTLSKGRTDVQPYLNEAVLQAFRDLGVNALNARMGYPPV